jgi:hypothetical protein
MLHFDCGEWLQTPTYVSATIPQSCVARSSGSLGVLITSSYPIMQELMKGFLVDYGIIRV